MNTFYEPHPGRAGAAIRLPDVIKLVADNISGKEMELDKAARIIEEAANSLVADGTFSAAHVDVHDDYIGVTLDEGEDDNPYPKHSFRVIRYK